jgi:TetR/AcrR family transcriptional regulator
VTNFVADTDLERNWARLLAWEGLAGAAAEDSPFFAAMVEDLRGRQQHGETAADLDPAILTLILFGAVLAPVVLPQVTRGMTGQAADDPAFLDAYRAQLRRIIARLAP